MTQVQIAIPPAQIAPGPFRGAPFSFRGQNGRYISTQLIFTAVNNCYLCSFNVGAAQQLPSMQSVYVDNLSNNNTVVLVAQDTNHRVVIPALSDGFFPIISNGVQLYAFVVGDFITDGTDQATNIFVTDVPIATAVTNDNIPGVDYQLVYTTSALVPNTQTNIDLFPKVYPSIHLDNVIGGADATPLPILSNITSKCFLTGLDVWLVYFANTTGADDTLGMTFNYKPDNGVVNELWQGRIRGPNGTIVYNVHAAHFENLQIPLFTNGQKSFNLTFGHTVKAGFDYQIMLNYYLGAVP